MQRKLTQQTTQTLDQILDTQKFAGDKTFLTGVWAMILAYGENLTAADIIETGAWTVAVYQNKDLSRLNFRHIMPVLSNAGLYACQNVAAELDKIPGTEQQQYIIDKVEHLVQNIDEWADIEMLRAARALEKASHALAAAEEARVVRQAELRAQSESKIASVLGLPALTGSVKQRAWAEEIRKKCLQTMPAEKIEAVAQRATTAKYWIDNYKNVLNK